MVGGSKGTQDFCSHASEKDALVCRFFFPLIPFSHPLRGGGWAFCPVLERGWLIRYNYRQKHDYSINDLSKMTFGAMTAAKLKVTN